MFLTRLIVLAIAVQSLSAGMLVVVLMNKDYDLTPIITVMTMPYTKLVLRNKRIGDDDGNSEPKTLTIDKILNINVDRNNYRVLDNSSFDDLQTKAAFGFGDSQPTQFRTIDASTLDTFLDNDVYEVFNINEYFTYISINNLQFALNSVKMAIRLPTTFSQITAGFLDDGRFLIADQTNKLVPSDLLTKNPLISEKPEQKIMSISLVTNCGETTAEFLPGDFIFKYPGFTLPEGNINTAITTDAIEREKNTGKKAGGIQPTNDKSIFLTYCRKEVVQKVNFSCEGGEEIFVFINGYYNALFDCKEMKAQLNKKIENSLSLIPQNLIPSVLGHPTAVTIEPSFQKVPKKPIIVVKITSNVKGIRIVI